MRFQVEIISYHNYQEIIQKCTNIFLYIVAKIAEPSRNLYFICNDNLYDICST